MSLRVILKHEESYREVIQVNRVLDSSAEHFDASTACPPYKTLEGAALSTGRLSMTLVEAYSDTDVIARLTFLSAVAIS